MAETARLDFGSGRFSGRNRIRTLLQIIGRQHLSRRHAHKIGVGHIIAAIGKRHARSFTQPAPAVDVVRVAAAQIVVLQNAENLPQRQAAGAGRAHAANFVFAISLAHGRALNHAVGFKIGHGQPARIIGRCGHGFHHLLCRRAMIKRRAARAGKQAHAAGEFRVFQHRACRQRPALRQKISSCSRIAAQILLVLRNRCGHARRHGKTLLRQAQRIVKQACPRQFAVALVYIFHQLGHTGRAHRAAAHHRLHKFQRLACFIEKQGRRGSFGRGFTRVKRGELFGLIIPIHQKRAAAQAR